MPEEQNVNRNQNLEDRAWKDMLSQLDTQMPVKKGFAARERWLFLLLLFLVISMGSYITYLHTSDRVSFPGEEQVQEEYFAAATPKSNDLDQYENAGQHENAIQQENTTQKDGSVVASGYEIKQIENRKQQVVRIDNSNETWEASSNNAIQLANIDQINIKSQAKEASLSNRLNNKSEAAVLEKPFDQQKRYIHHLSGLTAKNNLISFDAKVLELEDPLYADFSSAHISCPSVFQLKAGVVSENIFSFGGIETAILYEYALNNRTALRTGLGLSFYYKNGFSNSLALNAMMNNGKLSFSNNPDSRWPEYRYDFNIEESAIQNDELSVEYLAGVVDYLYYVDLPIEVLYKFRHLNVYGGVNINWLLRGTNKVKDYTDHYFNTVILSQNVLELNDYFHRLDLGLKLGVEKKIWKDLSMYASFNYGLSKILKDRSGRDYNNKIVDTWAEVSGQSIDTRVDYNRYFSIGLRYNINDCR